MGFQSENLIKLQLMLEDTEDKILKHPTRLNLLILKNLGLEYLFLKELSEHLRKIVMMGL